MSAARSERASGFRITGWHVLAGMVGFFGVVIAVDVTFAVLAYRTHPGQVSVTPYEDGILYNRHIAQLDAQAKLGWRDQAGRPIRGLALSARMERPATEAGRLTPRFVETAPGRYEADVGRLFGAWDLTVEAKDASGDDFLLERRLTWP